MTNKKRKNPQKRRKRLFAFALILALLLPCFTLLEPNKSAKANVVTNDTYTVVLPGVYLPVTLGSYTSFYFMPFYLGSVNGNLVIYYARSSDGRVPYYYQLVTPYTLDDTTYSLGGLVGAVRDYYNTFYSNVGLSDNLMPYVRYESINYDYFTTMPNNSLFYNELMNATSYIRVSYSFNESSTILAYTFYNETDVQLWKIFIGNIKPLNSQTTVLQNFNPTFITSTVNLNAYASELVKQAQAYGYDVGYDKGYSVGYREGQADNQFTFSALLSAVVNAPINAVKNMFNFDFLGTNLSTFLLSVLTVVVVCKVVSTLL